MKRNAHLVTWSLYFWTGLMLVLSSLPGDEIPEVSIWQWDKIAHSAGFFVLGILLFRYLWMRRGKTLDGSFWSCLVIGFLYGGLDELHQLFIPNRECSWQDFLADCIGVFAGAVIIRYYYQKRPRNAQPENIINH